MKNKCSTILKICVLFISLAFPLHAFGITNAKPLNNPALFSKPMADEEWDNLAYDISYKYIPEMYTAYYHLYGHFLQDVLTVTIANKSNKTHRFLVVSKIDGLSSECYSTVVVPPNSTEEVGQNPRLTMGTLKKITSQRHANLNLKVYWLREGKDALLFSDSVEMLINSHRDYGWNDELTTHENYLLYAAFITPNDSSVEELLRRAADHTEEGQMWSDYSADVEKDDDGAVWARLEAIWKAQEDYKLTYLGTTLAVPLGKSQRIRLPYEVLAQGGGNCIELTCLFASAVEALGLECAIVKNPTHTYLAVRTDQVNSRCYFIETTLIGRKSFAEAVEAGKERWIEDDPLLDSDEMAYQWIYITEAREIGILPVPCE